MKKINRTYLAGVCALVFAAWVAWQTTMIPERLVSNEPGPKMFPFISAAGIAIMAVLMMIFDGPKEDNAPYLDKEGWKRMGLIILESLVFCIGMQYIGFWITAMAGTFMFIKTLSSHKKINLPFAIIFSVVLASICYFGFTKGFAIPLPKGELWEMLNIPMP